MKMSKLIMCALAVATVIPLSAMPTREETARAEPVVKQLMASEQAAVKSGKKTRGEVAEVALRLACESDTEAAKLLLMKGAFVLYVKDGKVEKAAETMNAIETAIADLPPQSVTNMIEFALLGLPNKKEVRERLFQKLQFQRPDGRVASMRRPPAIAATSSKSPYQCSGMPKPAQTDRTTIQSIIDGMIKVPGRKFWLSATEVTQGQWETRRMPSRRKHPMPLAFTTCWATFGMDGLQGTECRMPSRRIVSRSRVRLHGQERLSQSAKSPIRLLRIPLGRTHSVCGRDLAGQLLIRILGVNRRSNFAFAPTGLI